MHSDFSLKYIKRRHVKREELREAPDFARIWRVSKLTRDGTAEPVSRDQILRRERGHGNINFLCSGDHEQDWEPYPVDSYSCYMCDHTIQHIKRRHVKREEPREAPDLARIWRMSSLTRDGTAVRVS